MHLLADSGSAFAINGFAGLKGAEQLSFWLSFLLFNGYVFLEAVSLTLFYMGSRPRAGGPNRAAIWYFFSSVILVMSFITTVWGAPAEKSFLNDAGTGLGVGTKMLKIFIGLLFAGAAVTCLLIGLLSTARSKRGAEGDAILI